MMYKYKFIKIQNSFSDLMKNFSLLLKNTKPAIGRL